MKVSARIAHLAAKFFPSTQPVVTYLVPADLDYETLRKAAELYWRHVPLDCRGQAEQLFYSQNPAFSALEQVAGDAVSDSSLVMEAECGHAIGSIMLEVALRLRNNTSA